MKFIFVSDLHSDRSLYYELECLIDCEKPDFLIIGGDIFAYSPHFEPQLEFVKDYFIHFRQRIMIPIYYIPGNCDKHLSIKYLNTMLDDSFQLLTLTGTTINHTLFIGYSHIQPSPFKIKDLERRELKEDCIVFEETCLLSDSKDNLNIVPGDFLNLLPSIEDDLSILNNKNSIWIMHAPPFGGILDKNYDNLSCGSKAIRKLIERVQPILTLHGHIHEAPYMSNMWSERIGNTISLNPGSGEVLHGVIIEMDNSGVLMSIKHTIFGELTI